MFSLSLAVVAGALVIAVVYAAIGQVACNMVRTRLRNRKALSIDEWHQHFYPDGSVRQEASEVVLNAFARAFDVEATLFHPSDRFSVELLVPGHGLFFDPETDIADDELRRALSIRGLTWPNSLSECESIGETIKCVSDTLEASPTT